MRCGHSCMLSPLSNAQAHFVANARVATKERNVCRRKWWILQTFMISADTAAMSAQTPNNEGERPTSTKRLLRFPAEESFISQAPLLFKLQVISELPSQRVLKAS